MLSLETRIRMAADVVRRPAVKAAFLYVGNIVGREVVAKIVALIRGAPEIAVIGLNCFADAIADASRVDALTGAIGIEFQNISAILFARSVVGIGDVGLRSDRYEHLLAVFGKDDVTGPVAATADGFIAAGQVLDDDFSRGASFAVAI